MAGRFADSIKTALRKNTCRRSRRCSTAVEKAASRCNCRTPAAIASPRITNKVKWLEQQLLLRPVPADYFLLIFTLSAEFRGVICEADIVACRHGQVSSRYRDGKTKKMAQRTLAATDFLWLILQHVLPKGLRRALNYGFLHPKANAR